MDRIAHGILQFDRFALDLRRGCLRRGEQDIHLRPKAFEVLRHLAENAGRLVSKDELYQTVWPNVVLSDDVLVQCILELRQKLGDVEHRLIKTVSRRGYVLDVSTDKLEEQRALDPCGSTRSAPPAANHDTKRAGPLGALFDNPEKSPPALTLPDKPSIAVLPFLNLSAEPEQEYFADGMVEDIIMALSRIPRLFVIARTSSFTYKGRAVDVRQVGRELGVRYVLEGSIRRAKDRVRITGQLIDATTGIHLWADRFDGGLEDLFELQDQMTESVVGAMAPKLEQAEIERVKYKPTESLDAYDYFLRGMSKIYQRTSEANSEALRLFGRSIELDADFAAAYGMAAWCYSWRKTNGRMTERAREVDEATRLARRAVELGSDDAVALTRGGHALAFVGIELERGAAFIDRGLVLNPNLAVAWYLSGWVRIYLGDPDLAIEHLTRGIRLSPLNPSLSNMQTGIGLAHFLAGRYDDASSWGEKAFRKEPNYRSAAGVTAASHALGGRLHEARKAMQRLRQIDPDLRASDLKDWFPLRRPEHFAMWAEALRQAGLPE